MGAPRDQHEREHGPDAKEGDEMRGPRGDWRAAFRASPLGASPLGRPNLAAPYALMKDHRGRALLSAVGLGTLLLLAIPLLAGIALLALFATAMFVGALFHLAPVILIGLFVYWGLSGRGRMPGAGHRRQQYREV